MKRTTPLLAIALLGMLAACDREEADPVPDIDLEASSLPAYILNRTPGTPQLRYVLIPAGIQVAARKSGDGANQVNWQELSYEAMKNIFNLRD
ncbi:hypothetical protein [Chitinophaga sp. XS-30]|uniref:hypothetical protein n=1 Tax=Chitinophaga sp. XS-30 TaxID=2604421 RepID=UPI0011DD6881|nr:hypothetical protein [Chitinophaga sp. XS-30]QEH39471.1 hypothetical protein FW415_00715 [Chitinophaga sp. XS-30]